MSFKHYHGHQQHLRFQHEHKHRHAHIPEKFYRRYSKRMGLMGHKFSELSVDDYTKTWFCHVSRAVYNWPKYYSS